jgi:transcriptional regulator with XRE-family HTH domain
MVLVKAMKTTLAFAKTLKEFRQAKKISQERLADLCDLDRTYISLLERGKRNPSIEIVFSLAKGLGISPSVLIKNVEKKTHENH